ncbi:MAG: Hsp20/alpha crystallin family protein [Isosphaeraceae bacterium]
MTELKEAPKAKTGNGPATRKEAAPPATAGTAAMSPFAVMRRFAREMNRLFEDFGLESGLHFPRFLSRGHELLRRESGLVPAEWSPRIDVQRRDGQFVVRADLPGMNKDDIKVEVTDDQVTIHGERKQEHKEEREGYRYSECSYGSFYRAIPLPEGAEGSKASAEFRNGVLEVTVPAPAQPEAKTRRLEIRDAR